MMRLIPLRPSAIRYALGVASCACALVGALSMTGRAGQLRSVTEGVYSGGQAARGQQIYQVQCLECHGKAMEGTIGPPLAGESFLADWSARPLSALVDKIQKTMPSTCPGAFPGASADLAAYMLQSGIPPGHVERSMRCSADVFPPARTSPCARVPAAASGAPLLPPPEGNLAELRGPCFSIRTSSSPSDQGSRCPPKKI